MSSKMNYIPHISSYEDIRAEMSNDLQYRLASRTAKTSLGRPLYYRINVQMITTQECPFHCPFCLERQNPMSGDNDFDAQIEALKRVLQEHPNARLSITGGEPGLYPKHIANIVETYRKHGNGVFCSINTTGFSTELNGLAHINLSRNDYVWTDPAGFPGCTVQTVVENPTLAFIKDYMKMDASSFSFRFLSGLERVCWNRQTGKLEMLVPIRACEFKSHYPHHGALLTNMTGARLPANGFPIESTPVMTK